MERAPREDRHHLRLVADAFLPPPLLHEREAPLAPLLYAAAPGTADTASVLLALRPDALPGGVRDLGSAVGVRLGRLERSGDLGPFGGMAPQLVWCPCGTEAIAVTAAMTLGRLGALIRPARVTILWFAGGVARLDRDPSPAHRQRVLGLARAALPTASVSLHCLGWREDPMRQLVDLVDRFH